MMKNIKIVFASGNKHKIEEFGAILKKYMPEIEVVSMKEVGIFDDIVEDGLTFEENAMIKARAVAKYGYIGVADDSGISVDALDGAPGIYSARYAGEHGNDKKNNQKLLADMEGIDMRGGAFVCAIACAFPTSMANEDFCVRGECRGVVLHEEKGDGGFGYDPLFFIEEYGKTFGELSAEIKNQISHRAVATELFAKRFCMELK
jgi:XTP/dITP diphosphohydrolase